MYKWETFLYADLARVYKSKEMGNRGCETDRLKKG